MLPLAMLASCSAPGSAADAPVIATLVVKPRVATSEPTAVLKPLRATLGQDAGIVYVRPMAGDAHVVHLTAPAQRGDVPQMLERLRASGAFQYVEVDAPMKAR